MTSRGLPTELPLRNSSIFTSPVYVQRTHSTNTSKQPNPSHRRLKMVEIWRNKSSKLLAGGELRVYVESDPRNTLNPPKSESLTGRGGLNALRNLVIPLYAIPLEGKPPTTSLWGLKAPRAEKTLARASLPVEPNSTPIFRGEGSQTPPFPLSG